MIDACGSVIHLSHLSTERVLPQTPTPQRRLRRRRPPLRRCPGKSHDANWGIFTTLDTGRAWVTAYGVRFLWHGASWLLRLLLSAVSTAHFGASLRTEPRSRSRHSAAPVPGGL